MNKNSIPYWIDTVKGLSKKVYSISVFLQYLFCKKYTFDVGHKLGV